MMMRARLHRGLFVLMLAGASLGAGCSGSAGTCSYGGKAYEHGKSFPADDGCNTCSCTATGVACTLRACQSDAGQDGDATAPNDDATSKPDTGVHDAAADAAPAADAAHAADAADAAGSCAVTDTYRFGWSGGNGPYSSESTLSPPDHYRHVRTSYRGNDGPAALECAPALPPCGSQDAVSLLDIVRDLDAADVRAAFAQSAPPLFGVDSRPVDGAVYSVVRADGHGLLVGSPCAAPAVDCHAIPPHLQTLVDHLKALDTAQLAKPACAIVGSP
jgi:hypothetical protein